MLIGQINKLCSISNSVNYRTSVLALLRTDYIGVDVSCACTMRQARS